MEPMRMRLLLYLLHPVELDLWSAWLEPVAAAAAVAEDSATVG